MENKDNLLKLASAINSVFGDGDKNLGINRVVFKQSLLSGKIRKFIIYSSRVGLIIGRQGKDLEKLKIQVEKEFGYPVKIELKEYEPIPILSNYSYH